MARRRKSEIELNFDGLTDSVTNLVGALILIVLLMIGVTTSSAPSAPAPAQRPAPVGSESAEQLLMKIEYIRAQIRAVRNEQDSIAAELSAARVKVGELSGVSAPDQKDAVDRSAPASGDSRVYEPGASGTLRARYRHA